MKEDTISVKRYKCDYLVLLIYFLGLCSIGCIIELLFIIISCYINNKDIVSKDCFHINYWIYGIFCPIIGLMVWIICLLVSDICGKIIYE